MKRTILVLSLFLFACTQEIPLTAVPFKSPTAPATKTSTPTQIPVVDVTPTSESFQPASALSAGPVTLVAIGDSLTAGDGDDSDQGGYTGRLLGMVSALRPDSQLINLGKSGWSSDALINGDQGLTGQLPRAVNELNAAKSQGRAAVALVWIGSNDLWYLYEYGDGSDANDTLDAERFSANMDAILSQLRNTGAQVIIALLDDQSKRPVAVKGQAFTSITADELKRMSAQVLRYNEIISEKAKLYGALTVDFYSTTIFTDPATLYNDGNHPNSAGYDIIAKKWFDVLKSLLN